MTTHAKLSPSSAVRWMTCPGSVTLSEGIPDKAGKFADEGTDAHELAAVCLGEGTDASSYLGVAMEKGHIVDTDMAMHVQTYIDYVRSIVGDNLLAVEQRLDIEFMTGEKGAAGTSDVVAIVGDELIVVDLKYGMGVRVDAKDNPQLQMYAAAAVREFDILQDFKTVRMIIVQPRLNAVSEWVQNMDEMADFVSEVATGSHNTRSYTTDYQTSEKGCQFCRAKAICPAIEKDILDTFDMVTPDDKHSRLAMVMDKANMIEAWIKAIRAEVESRLLAGDSVPGWKIVQGKRGNRAWTSKEAAEDMLKEMRLKHSDMYDYSFISPTTAEKLNKKDVLGDRQWAKVQSLITQSEGKPSVAPDSDSRPVFSMSVSSDDFNDVS